MTNEDKAKTYEGWGIKGDVNPGNDFSVVEKITKDPVAIGRADIEALGL